MEARSCARGISAREYCGRERATRIGIDGSICRYDQADSCERQCPVVGLVSSTGIRRSRPRVEDPHVRCIDARIMMACARAALVGEQPAVLVPCDERYAAPVHAGRMQVTTPEVGMP